MLCQLLETTGQESRRVPRPRPPAPASVACMHLDSGSCGLAGTGRGPGAWSRQPRDSPAGGFTSGREKCLSVRGSCCCLRFAVLCGQVPWINTQGESASVTCRTQRLAARQFSVLRQINKPASEFRPHRPGILRGRRRGRSEPPTGRALTWGVVRGTPGGILSLQPASAWAPCGAPP